jgi:hypothetical protein
VHKDVLDLIRLLDLDANPHAIDARLDQDFLMIISGNSKWVQKDLGRTGGFDFGNIVPFCYLRGEVR